MASIDEIPGISGAILDLFRAAGVESSEQLLSLGSEDLIGRLDQANGDGKIMPRLPAMALLEAWRNAAAVLEGREGAVRRPVELPKGDTRDPQPRALPTARPMSVKQLREAGISAVEVPIGTLLPEEGVEDSPLEVPEENKEGKAGGRQEPAEPEPKPRTSPTESETRSLVQRVDLGARQERERRVSRKVADEIDFSAIGKNQPAAQRTQKRNHGMLHREPRRVYAGALATLAAMILVFGGFLAAGAALIYALIMEEPVPEPMAWGLLVFPVAVLLHLTLGLRPRCRLCGQQLFRPKSCNKHVKAHRSPFGHIFAVALHAVTRGWFRCMLCGTKQRLRE